jgi:transposase-like protein
MGMKKAEVEFLMGLAGPRHWSEEDARRVLELLAVSGDSRADFARRYGLRASRLAWWRHRLDEWEPDGMNDASEAAPLRPFVQLVSTRGAATASVATVRVGDLVIELATLDAESARFIAVLRDALRGDVCS